MILEEANIRSSQSFLSTVVIPKQVRLKSYLGTDHYSAEGCGEGASTLSVNVCVCLFACIYVGVCVCVCERESAALVFEEGNPSSLSPPLPPSSSSTDVLAQEHSKH